MEANELDPTKLAKLSLTWLLGAAVVEFYKRDTPAEQIHGMADDIIGSGMPPESIPGWMFLFALSVHSLRETGTEAGLIHQVIDHYLQQAPQFFEVKDL